MNTGVTTYNHFSPKGMAGLFGWLRKKLNKLVRILQPFIPPRVFLALDDFTNGDGEFNFGYSQRRGEGDFNIQTDLPLTSEDEAILDDWFETFKGYIIPKFDRLKTLRESTPTVKEMGVVYNDIQKTIAVIKHYQQYVLVNGERGYSVNAIQARNEFLSIQVSTLQETLDELLSQFSIKLDPIQENISVMPTQYINMGFNVSIIMSIPTLFFRVRQIDDIQITDEDNGTNIIDDIVVPPSPGSDLEKTKGVNPWKLGFGAVLLLLLLSRRKKTKN